MKEVRTSSETRWEWKLKALFTWQQVNGTKSNLKTAFFTTAQLFRCLTKNMTWPLGQGTIFSPGLIPDISRTCSSQKQRRAIIGGGKVRETHHVIEMRWDGLQVYPPGVVAVLLHQVSQQELAHRVFLRGEVTLTHTDCVSLYRSVRSPQRFLTLTKVRSWSSAILLAVERGMSLDIFISCMAWM